MLNISVWNMPKPLLLGQISHSIVTAILTETSSQNATIHDNDMIVTYVWYIEMITISNV